MSKIYLSYLLQQRQNNFDFLRFFAASLVIFSHAFPITDGNELREPLIVWSQQESLGGIAVAIFFIISGFLITQSYAKNAQLLNFIKKRALRILPALIVVTLLTTFILGPIFTTLPLKQYFTTHTLYSFFVSNITVFNIQYGLPGIFANNPYPNIVNGSLWTLKYEILCYVMVCVLGMFFTKKTPHIVIMGLISCIAGFYWFKDKAVSSAIINSFHLLGFFMSGMLMYYYRHKILISHKLAGIALIAILLSLRFGFFYPIFVTCGAYLIIYIAFNPVIKLNQFGKYGDYSYGIYIYAFPVQQTLTYLANNQITWWQNALLTFPITLLLAFLSWHLIEKQALKLKKIDVTIPNITTHTESAENITTTL